MFDLNGEINLRLETSNSAIKCFLAAHCVMRIELIKGIRKQLIPAIHEECCEAGLGRCVLFYFETMLLTIVRLFNRLLDQALYQIFVFHFI